MADRITVTATLLTAALESGGTNISTTGIVSPTAGKLVLLYTSNENYGGNPVAAAPLSIVGAGLNFTKVDEIVQFAGSGTASLWCACSDTTSTGAITITQPIAKSTCTWVITEYDVAASAADNGLSAILQHVAQAGSDVNNPPNVITAGLADFENAANAVAVFGSHSLPSSGTPTSTPSAGVTEISDQFQLTPNGYFIHTCSYFKASADKNAGYTNAPDAGPSTVAAIAVELKSRSVPTPPTPEGGGGSGYFAFKTVAQLELEKEKTQEQELVKIKKRAAKRVVKAIREGLLTVKTAPAFVEQAVEASIPNKVENIPVRDINAIIARIKAEAKRALIRRQQEEDEDDLEVLLLAG